MFFISIHKNLTKKSNYYLCNCKNRKIEAIHVILNNIWKLLLPCYIFVGFFACCILIEYSLIEDTYRSGKIIERMLQISCNNSGLLEPENYLLLHEKCVKMKKVSGMES